MSELIVCLRHLVSSAKINGREDFRQLGRSLMKRTKNSGPRSRMLPCGTPDRIGRDSEQLSFIQTYWCRLVK